MHAYLAAPALTVAPSELFPRVIHSTTSMLMFAYPAVPVKHPALQALSLKADISIHKSLSDYGDRAEKQVPLLSLFITFI